MVEAVCHVEAQSVDIKFLHPTLDAGENVIDDVFIMKVQLYEIIVALPAFIP